MSAYDHGAERSWWPGEEMRHFAAFRKEVTDMTTGRQQQGQLPVAQLTLAQRRDLRRAMAEAITIMDKAYEHVRRVALYQIGRVK